MKEAAMAGRASTGIWMMDGRTVLVTGTTSGIGRVTAAALGQAGAVVLAHARDQARAAEVVRELQSSGGRFVPVSGDLGSLAGVRDLVEQVRQVTPEGLHVLVNNAGAAFPQRALSPDGVERTLAVNHLAVAALTSLLLETLRNAASMTGRPSRVVNLSSTMEKRGNPKLQDWSHPTEFSQLQAYSDSKLVNLAYTYALARELAGSGVTVNAANPGSVATAFGRNAGGVLKMVQIVGKAFMASPEKGAHTPIRLASDPTWDGATGGYYSAAELAASSEVSRDPAFGQQVYAHTTAILAQTLR
ncbi:SDR family NAD(P)-dependent oxidoreductase [Streptomyces fildesensis]|uniref:SDR family NAD(P)-dependent oxidoreductase n=1 Tax=Streptomyces fildesensis TaxID=375757 RepID=A0ABW8CG51_9ACTN